MSQELLFLLFMTCELIAIMALYTFWIIPRVALKTNNLFEERMLDKTWDIPAMLEDYTEHLTGVFSELIKKSVPDPEQLTEVFAEQIKKLVPNVIGGMMSAEYYGSCDCRIFRRTPRTCPDGCQYDAPKNQGSHK